MTGEVNGGKILLFDGYCNLCSGIVRFVIENEKKDQIMFAPLSSETGQKLKDEYGITDNSKETLVFLEDGNFYTKSEGAARLFQYLKFPYPLLGSFIKMIPDFLSDIFYDLVARYRYRIFGKKETCMAPAPEIEERFLE